MAPPPPEDHCFANTEYWHGRSATQKASAPTDLQIEAPVQQALAKDNAFKGSIISGVNKGVVTLTGNARSEAEKALASQDRVRGRHQRVRQLHE